MRTYHVALLILFSAPASSQLHAGEVPDGSSAVTLNINLELNAPFTTDMATFEVDCDDQPDMRVVLVQGAPPVDAPNVAMLELLDDDLELCMGSGRPQYYDMGELLDCTGGFDWQSDSINILGDFGGFTSLGPAGIESQYIAYRRGAQVGWIRVTFNVAGSGPVQLQVLEVLPICPATTSIAQPDASGHVALFPNPTDGAPIKVQAVDALRSLDVLDASGRSIAHYNGTVRTIAAPEATGAYLLAIRHADGHRSVARLVRY